jgi:hypothetical protein
LEIHISARIRFTGIRDHPSCRSEWTTIMMMEPANEKERAAYRKAAPLDPGEEQEPPEVIEARKIVECWEKRNGHDAYTDVLEGGWKGFQARCWDCGWQGPERLRGDEEMGTPESQQHKANAHADAVAHRRSTRTSYAVSD